MTRDRKVSVSRVIPVDAQTLFDIVADPRMHPMIDGSGSVRATRGQLPARLYKGARFGMAMRQGPVPYPIQNVVVEFEEGRRIAWRHLGGHRWRYEFEATGDGTRVTETFDWSSIRHPLGHWYITLVGWPRRNLAAMRQTLERLERVALERQKAGDRRG